MKVGDPINKFLGRLSTHLKGKRLVTQMGNSIYPCLKFLSSIPPFLIGLIIGP